MRETPFRVTWQLVTPLAEPSFPIHLDAVLAAAMVERELPANVTGSREEIRRIEQSLPLAKWQEGEGEGGEVSGRTWCYRASQLLIEPLGESFLVPMVRRFDLHDVIHESDRGAITPLRKQTFAQGTGGFKDYNMRLELRWIKEIQAYGVGDPGECQSLLETILFLGRERRNGWGQVKTVTVTEDQEAHERWKWRTLPWPGPRTEMHAEGTANATPPYWDRTTIKPVWEWTGQMQAAIKDSYRV